jgi:hypothetical protein
MLHINDVCQLVFQDIQFYWHCSWNSLSVVTARMFCLIVLCIISLASIAVSFLLFFFIFSTLIYLY